MAETGEDLFLQQEVPVQTGAPPAAGGSLLLGVGGPVTLGLGAVSPQLSSHCRWRAIQTCRDLAD